MCGFFPFTFHHCKIFEKYLSDWGRRPRNSFSSQTASIQLIMEFKIAPMNSTSPSLLFLRSFLISYPNVFNLASSKFRLLKEIEPTSSFSPSFSSILV